jgi:hypothetical protein
MNVDGIQRNSEFPNIPLFVRRNLPNWLSYNKQIQKNLLDTDPPHSFRDEYWANRKYFATPTSGYQVKLGAA